MRRLVILRPEPGASATAERARKLGIEADVMPLFAIEPVAWEIPDGEFDGLLLTSANALQQAGPSLERLRDLPVHAVGESTSEAARLAGLRVETIGTAGIDALLAQLPGGLRLLHLTGEHRRRPSAPDQAITSVTVYRSAELPVPPELERLTSKVVAVHSPRSAGRLASLVTDRSIIAIAAISQAAADAAGEGWEAIAVAHAPTDEALLALAQRLCEKAVEQ
jgi:uroporphyrinogen-III synthase